MCRQGITYRREYICRYHLFIVLKIQYNFSVKSFRIDDGCQIYLCLLYTSIVKPIEFGTLERFHDQECQYTLQLRGFVDGEPKEITRQITSVVDAVAAIEDYDKYIEYGTSETLRFIVSNTTEAGIVFDETDNDPNARPPKTYPGTVSYTHLDVYKRQDN